MDICCVGTDIFFSSVMVFEKLESIAQDFTERAITGKEEQARNALAEMYAKTFINGPLFLWKLYATEVVESIMQIVNFFHSILVLASGYSECDVWHCSGN